jgi:hypothetical protein
MLMVLACAFGIYVGLQFNILALLPLSLFGSGVYILTCWSSGVAPLHNMEQLVVPLVTLQLGYFIGLTAREVYRHLLIRLKAEQSRRA